MASRSNTKDRILEASTLLFRRQGYEGTGLKEIVAKGRAPWGSLYHFFPQGKEQLGVEVVMRYGEYYRCLLENNFVESSSVIQAVRDIFTASATELVDSDFANGCPIVGVALDAMNSSSYLRQACAEIINSWVATLASGLVVAGISEFLARDVATSIVSGLEGGTVLSRITRSTRPLMSASDAAVMAIRSALSDEWRRESSTRLESLLFEGDLKTGHDQCS